ncbi:MAG: hypothetical protein JNM99_05570 [Verrucomicrobiaceae bacterium]|nr:hypothetical protein [Verrucomicrobiaceae bacterium]
MRFTTRIDAETFDELLRPKLRLFLSVDIVGSTSFKHQQTKEPGPRWVFSFLSFYQSFHQILDTAVLPAKPARSKRIASSVNLPLLWKALGDELIFVVELRQRHEAAHYLCAFRRALQETQSNWYQSAERMQFKGTAWLAGFPLGNVEVPFDEMPDRKAPLPDFIGPQIDAGFRLKEHATPRKIVLSADLAYLLVKAGSPGMDLFFDGDQSLKGILHGKPYPLIWLDGDVRNGASKTPSLQQHKDKLLGRKRATPKLLSCYLEAWLTESRAEVPKPFIATDPFGDLRPPHDYAQRLNAWKATMRSNFLFLEKPDEKDKGLRHLPKSVLRLLDL